jgi:D-alanine-D-alanine ligase
MKPEKSRKNRKTAYNSLGMSGFSRSEYIIMNGIPYMLEMNTNSGFSPASILPQQAKIYGISIKDFVETK